MRTIGMILCVALTMSALPVLARDDGPVELESAKAKILTCLSKVDEAQDAISSGATDAEWDALPEWSDCIGSVADPCQKAEGYTTYGMMTCLGSEREAWDALLAQWLEAALVDASPARRAVIEESQALWLSAMERSLDIYAVEREEAGGGTIWGVLYAGDANNMTAQRALWVYYASRGPAG